MVMVAILLNGQIPFVQIFNPPLTEGSTCSSMKIGVGGSEKLFRQTRVDDDEFRFNDASTHEGHLRQDERGTESDHNRSS